MTSEQNDELNPPTAPAPPPATPVPPVFNGESNAPAAPSAPVAPPAPAPVRQKKRTTLVRIIAGVAAALVVILLKVGAIAGLVHLFSSHDHKVKPAEEAVRSVLQTDDTSTADRYFVAKPDIQPACAFMTNEAGNAKFIIESSSRDSTGANVAVKLDDGHKLAVHLVDSSGWKIDKISCQ